MTFPDEKTKQTIDAKSDQEDDSVPDTIKECARRCSQKCHEYIESIAFILRTDSFLEQLPTVVEKIKHLEECDSNIKSCSGECVCQTIHDACQKVQGELIKHKTMLADIVIELKTAETDSTFAQAVELSSAITFGTTVLVNCLDNLSHCPSEYALDQKDAIQKTNALVENVAGVKFAPQPIVDIEQLLESKSLNSLSAKCFKSYNNKLMQLHEAAIWYATKNFEGILSGNTDEEVYQQFQEASTRVEEFTKTFKGYYENCMAGESDDVNSDSIHQ